jgi:hypothetical protein
MAIGELMTITEAGELYCMGYAAFRTKYYECARARKVTLKDVHELEKKSMMEDHQSRLELGESIRHFHRTSGDVTFTRVLEDPNPDFFSRFQPLVDGVETVSWERCAYFDAVSEGKHTMPDVSDKKIRRLQHLLYDLEKTLDPDHSAADPHSRDHCQRVARCAYSSCQGNLIYPSPDKKEVACVFAHRTAGVGQHY